MTKAILRSILCLIVVLLMGPANACMWDSDTLIMERQQFPRALELITGKFIHHSDVYYQWRIKDRVQKLKLDPDNLNLQDDLAVAYDKTGNHGEAIAIATRQLDKYPKRYETLANLGTFYIHNGQFEKGIKYIDQAIGVNPDAHFGREVYQKHLVEYILSDDYKARFSDKYLEGELELNDYYEIEQYDFAAYLLKKGVITENREGVNKAIKGILGMMRFGNHKSPVLLDALASLLLFGFEGDAKQLASRAYLKAAMESKDERKKRYYKKLAQHALYMQENANFYAVEAQLTTELVEADGWFADIECDEKDWVTSGTDLDAAFNQKYYREPSISFNYAHLMYAMQPYLLYIVAGGLLLFIYIFQPKNKAKPDRVKQEFMDLIRCNISLPRAFWFYFMACTFLLFIFSIFLIILTGGSSYWIKIPTFCIIAICQLSLCNYVWKAGLKSVSLWRGLSRVAAILVTACLLYFLMHNFFFILWD